MRGGGETVTFGSGLCHAVESGRRVPSEGGTKRMRSRLWSKKWPIWNL